MFVFLFFFSLFCIGIYWLLVSWLLMRWWWNLIENSFCCYVRLVQMKSWMSLFRIFFYFYLWKSFNIYYLQRRLQQLFNETRSCVSQSLNFLNWRRRRCNPHSEWLMRNFNYLRLHLYIFFLLYSLLLLLFSSLLK